MNFSSFLARYHGSKAYKPWDSHLKYPSVDIELALEDPLPSGKLGECRLLVASNWFIHAGKLIYEDMKGANTEKWGLSRWSRWTEKIQEILKTGGQTDEVTSNLQAALDSIMSIATEKIEIK